MGARAVIYARISVSAQESVSIARQVEAGHAYALSRGWDVVATFTDEGVSATHTQPSARAGWSALMAHPEPFDHVIIWKVDRLARRIVVFNRAVDELTQSGRSLVSIVDNLDMSSTIGQIVAGVLAGFAQMEAEAIRDRVTAARRHRVKNGRLPGGTIPYGWMSAPNPDGPGYVLTQDPDRVDYVRQAAQKALAGATVYSVVQWLDEVGAPLPRASQSRRKKAGWSYSTVERLLRNPVLAGMTAFNPGNRSKERGGDVVRDENGLPVVDESVAVLPVSEWRRLIESLDNRDSAQSKPRALRSKTSALLSGLVWCGECDARMHRGTSQGRESFSCPKCHQTISRIEPYVIEHFLWAKGEYHRLARVEEVLDGAAAQLPEIEHRMAELTARMQETDDDDEADRLTGELANLRRLRREVRNAPANRIMRPVRTDRTYAEDWEVAQSVEDRRAVLDDALDRIEIRRGRVGRGLDKGRLTFRWRFPDQVGPIPEPAQEDLAEWAEG